MKIQPRLKNSVPDSIEYTDTLRWLASFGFVVLVHIGVVILVINWPESVADHRGEPLAAMVVELAPIPVAPKMPPVAAPFGQLQQEIEPLPEPEPEPEPEEIDLPPDIPEVEHAELILPKQPEVVEESEQLEPQEPVQEQPEQAPLAVDTLVDDVAAAPSQGALSLGPSDATANWQVTLLGHLERHKRYPRKSRRKRQEAVVYVKVKINRDGTVIDHRLEQPSAYEALNQESLALITRAQPFPPPPDDITGDSIEFVVPIAFSLQR